MKTSHVVSSYLAVQAASFAVVLATTPLASADPEPGTAPAPVIDVAALPVPGANWAAGRHDRIADVLPGVAACSVDGIVADDDLDARAKPAGPVFVADLVAQGDAQGWAANVSGANYASVNESSYALDAYRRYLDACRTAPEAAAGFRNAAVGTSALDPTMAHALIETGDQWVEVFATATDEGLLELALTHPKDGPVTFEYNPAAVFSALKGADLAALTDSSEQL